MQKLHSVDLLNFKTSSRFVSIVDEHSLPATDTFWHCLINEAAKRYSCLVISSRLYSYKFATRKVQILYTDDFKNVFELLTACRNYLSSEEGQSTVCMFFEYLPWLVYDCPSTWDFGCWTQKVLALLFDLSLDSRVSRLTTLFFPVRHRFKHHFLAHSKELCEAVQQFSTTVILCHPSDVSRKCDENLSNLSVSVCHRRSLQGCYPHHGDLVRVTNKPAYYENVLISIDLSIPSFVKIMKAAESCKATHPTDPSAALPESSFALTLTESESLARDQLILPFILDHPKPASSSNDKSSIHYTPDCFDDLDEEDPDDDLDI